MSLLHILNGKLYRVLSQTKEIKKGKCGLNQRNGNRSIYKSISISLIKDPSVAIYSSNINVMGVK